MIMHAKYDKKQNLHHFSFPFKENPCAGLKDIKHIFLNEVRLMASIIASE